MRWRALVFGKGRRRVLTSSYSSMSILHSSNGHRCTELTQLRGRVSRTVTPPLLASLLAFAVAPLELFLHWWSSSSRYRVSRVARMVSGFQMFSERKYEHLIKMFSLIGMWFLPSWIRAGRCGFKMTSLSF